MCPASGRFVWAIGGAGRSKRLVCSRAQRKKEKNRRLMANFAHAQPRPLWTDCNQILSVGLGVQCDHWCQVLWKSIKGFWSYRTPSLIRHFLHLTFIALTTVSALPCCTVIWQTQNIVRSNNTQMGDLDTQIKGRAPSQNMQLQGAAATLWTQSRHWMALDSDSTFYQITLVQVAPC